MKPNGDGPRRVPGFGGGVRGGLEFVREVYDQAASDDIFFLASGLTFSIMLAAIPFLALLLAVAGAILAPQMDAPRTVVLDWVGSLLPVSKEVEQDILAQLVDVVEISKSLGFISAVLFVWFSTRLFGALAELIDAAKRHLVNDFASVVETKLEKHSKPAEMAKAVYNLCGLLRFRKEIPCSVVVGLRGIGIDEGIQADALHRERQRRAPASRR